MAGLSRPGWQMKEQTEIRATGSQPLIRGPDDRRALTVMTVSHGIQHFYVAGLAVTYPFVVAQFGISYAVLGGVLTAAGLLGGFLQGSAGLLRRLTTRAVLTAQNAGLAVASLAAAVAPGFAVFGAARLVGSAASWPQHPVGSAYLSQRFPNRRATALSWHTAGGSIGTAIVPLLAAAVIAVAGWRWALAALGGALGIGALLVSLALPGDPPPSVARPPHPPAGSRDSVAADPPHPRADPPHALASPPSPLASPPLPVEAEAPRPAGAAETGGEGQPNVTVWRLLRRRRVAAVLAASTIAAGGRGLGTLSTYIPAYLRSGLHLPALSVGTLFTVVMVASIGGQILGGMMADRFGRVRTLVVVYLAAAAAIAAFGFAGHHLPVLAVLGALVGLLAYAESPLLQSLFSDLTQDGAARSAFGAFFAIAYGFGALWLTVIGSVITTAGFAAAFVTMAGSFVAAALIIVVGVREPESADAARG